MEAWARGRKSEPTTLWRRPYPWLSGLNGHIRGVGGANIVVAVGALNVRDGWCLAL